MVTSMGDGGDDGLVGPGRLANSERWPSIRARAFTPSGSSNRRGRGLTSAGSAGAGGAIARSSVRESPPASGEVSGRPGSPGPSRRSLGACAAGCRRAKDRYLRGIVFVIARRCWLRHSETSRTIRLQVIRLEIFRPIIVRPRTIGSGTSWSGTSGKCGCDVGTTFTPGNRSRARFGGGQARRGWRGSDRERRAVRRGFRAGGRRRRCADRGIRGGVGAGRRRSPLRACRRLTRAKLGRIEMGIPGDLELCPGSPGRRRLRRFHDTGRGRRGGRRAGGERIDLGPDRSGLRRARGPAERRLEPRANPRPEGRGRTQRLHRDPVEDVRHPIASR